MLTLTLRNIRQHPARYISTTVAIVLGIAFFVGTSVLTETVKKEVNNAVGELFADTDVVVRSTETIDVGGGTEFAIQIPASVAEIVAPMDGVEDALAGLAGYAQIVGHDGKVLSGQSFGTNWADSDLFPLSLVDGRGPEGPNEIIIDRGSFNDGGFTLGDQVSVLPRPLEEKYTIVGVAANDDEDSVFGMRIVGFEFETATMVLGTDVTDQILIQAEGGISPDQLVESLNAQGLPDGLEAVTGEAATEEIREAIGGFISIINTILQVFALIALGVGIFIIYNTFTILVAQRSREMALMRAIGATGRQVRRAVRIESFIIGVVSSALGSIAGIGLGWLVLKLLGSIGLEISASLAIPQGTMAVGIVIGTVITMASAYFPSRKAAKIPPLAALREVATGEAAVGRPRLVVGIIILLIGAVAVGLSLAGGTPWWLALAAVAILVGMIVVGPFLMRPLSVVLGLPLAKARGIAGEIAQQNAARSPKRTANTASALMIGVMLVTAASVFASSLKASLIDKLEEQVVADHLVEVNASVANSGGGLSPDVAQRVASIEGVQSVARLRQTFGQINETMSGITALDADQIESVFELGLIEGSFDDLGPTTVATSRDDVALGDTMQFVSFAGLVELEVVARYSEGDIIGNWLADISMFEELDQQSLDLTLFLVTDGQASTIAAIEAEVADNPVVEVTTKQEFIDEQAGSVNLMLNLLYGLLGVSVLVAVVGIVNTMSLSIIERTREIGLLRAVGMTRRQIRSSIRYEAAIVAIIGTVVGLVVGGFFAWLAVEAVRDTFPEFVVPWGSLIVIAVIGLICGIVAGILPAIRAARLNVLDAIGSE